MKVAFVGKGGSGKTTLSALFCRYLASLQVPVLAFDAGQGEDVTTQIDPDFSLGASFASLPS